MNHIYRLVFNRALGILQVASELATSAGGSSRTGAGPLTGALRAVSFALWVAMGWVGLVVPGAAQQATTTASVPSAGATGRIVSDPGAPPTQRPTVIAAPNGTPVVNITTPSAAGVSRNTYSQFDVGTQGAILNNARTNTQTQLGGWVQGNPWLATGTARVILNEVNSAHPSYLNGYIEVAGDRAEVIIANPAGIQVDGGGFLNASRATLTTGTPVFAGGSLDHYRVTGGVIGMSGAGLDASGTDYTHLIARSLQINAGLWAQHLSVTAGTNTVDAASGAVQANASSSPAPTVAIDVGQLGGMYAGKIVLIGTEHGVGVRNAGEIGAQAGDLVVTVDGRLENTGSLQAQQDAQISAVQGIANTGMLSAGRELSVTTAAGIDNSGGTLNAMRIELDAQALRNRDGSIEQTGIQALALNAGMLSNRDGGRIGDIGEEPGEGGNTPGGEDPPGGSDDGASGQPGNGGEIVQPPAPPAAPLADGALNIAGLLDNDGGRIVAGGGVDLATAQGLDNDSGQLGLRALTVSQGDVSNRAGTLTVLGPARFDVGVFDNDAGTFNANQSLMLSAQWLSNRGGVLNHAGSDATRIAVRDVLDNTDGTLASNASALNVGSGQLINERGVIQQSGTQGLTLTTGRLDGNGGTIATAGALTLSATDIAHREATLSASQVTLTATGLDNTGGQIVTTGTAANTLTVTGTLDNTAGVLASNGDLSLAATTLTNVDGVVQQAGTGMLAIAAQTLNGQGGTLVSNGALTITGQTTDLREGTTSAQRIAIDTGDLTTAGGQLTATGTEVLSLQVRNTLDNTGGTVGTNGALDIAAQTLNNRQGVIVAAGTSPSSVAVTMRLDNAGGTLSFNGDSTLEAGELLNAGGTVLAAETSALQVTVDGLLDNSAGGRLAAGGDLGLGASTLDNRSGSIEQAGEGELDIQADTLLGEGGRISSQGALALTGEDIDLRGGTTLARDIAVTAGTLTTADGMLASTGEDALRVQVREDLNNDRGTIAANGALDLDAGALSNREGVLTSAGMDNTHIRVTHALDNTDGTLASNASALEIDSGHLINARGVIRQSGTQGLTLTTGRLDGNAGTIATAGALTVSATDIAHRDATLSASQVTLMASGLDNSGGQIVATGTAANTLSVAGTLDNTYGVLASNGDLFLAASTLANVDGVVQQAGTGTLAIAAQTLNGQGGTLVSNGALTISGQTTDLREGTTSAQRIAIDTGDLTTAGGQLTATGTEVLSLQVRNTLDNSGGTIGGNGTMDLAATTFANAGGVLQAAGAGQNRMLVAGGFDNRGGTLLAAGDARVQAGELVNVAGTLQVAGALQLDVAGRLDNSAQGIIASGSDMQLTAGEVDNQAGVLGAGGALDVTSATGIDNTAGTVQAGGVLSLASDGLVNRDATVIGAQVRVDARGQAFDNTSGTLASTAGGMSVSGGALDNTAGLLQSAGDLAIDTAGQTLTNAQSGSTGGIVSAGRLDIRSGDLANQAGVVFSQSDATLAVGAIDNTNAGSLGSAVHLTIQGVWLSNTGGTVQAGGDASLTLSGELDNQAGLIAADETLTVAAATIDNRDTRSDANPALGLQAGRLHLEAGSLDNRQGQLIADTDGRIAVTGALDNSTGLVSTDGTLDIGADAIVNTDGTLISGDHQTLAARRLSGDGQALSRGNATLVLQDDFVNTGEVTANGVLSLTTAGDLLNAGTLQAGQLDLRAADIDNSVAGEMTALGVARFEAQGTLTNRGLIDGAVTHVQAGVVDNLGTGRLYGDHVAIEAGEVRNRAETVDGLAHSATIAARLQLDLGVGTLDNTGGGLIYSGGNASIGGALDGDLLTTGTAGTVNNVSSIIDVGGDLGIHSQTVNNTRENVAITRTTVVQAPVRLDQPDWRNNGSNSTTDIRSTSNYFAYEVYYLHPDDILEDTPYITPDGFSIRRAVIRLTPQTSAYFFARGGLYGALGERSRMEGVQEGTFTLYYFGRQDGQANPDQVADGADNPFLEVSAPSPGDPAFGYISDNLTYSNAYGTCTTNCVQLWAQYAYDDPDHILINPRGTGGGGLGDNEQYRIATRTVTDDVLAPGAGADAVIRAGGEMRIGTDALTNRYGQIAAGGNLIIEGLTAAATVTNIGQTLFRTHSFDNVTHAYNGTTRDWSNPPLSEEIGQVGGSISSGGTLVIDVGDLSNLDEGRDAPNVQDGAALANLDTRAPASGAPASATPPDRTPGRVGGIAALTSTAEAPLAVDLADSAVVVSTSVQAVAGQQASDTHASSPGTVGVAALDLQLPTSSLFTVQPNGGSYLIETDPRFADYRNWLGSDYLLNALGYSPTDLHKRLGDGYYEQKLIRDQIGQLTGRRFLTGYSNEEDQFRALMEAGAVFARQFGLRPGVALSAEQMAQLTSDIVWLVEQTVTLADGSTATVLVPQVYLRLRPGDLSDSGALLAGENVHLNLRGDLVNRGDIAGRQVVSINAGNIHNLQGGAISGRAVGLQATQDIDITGATVTALDVLSVRAGGDVTVASTTQIHSEYGDSTRYFNRVAGLYVTNPGGLGVLSVDAGGDITLQAAQIHNAGLDGLTQLAAVGNVNLTTLTTGRSTDTTGNARNYHRTNSTTHVGTTVQGAGNVVVQAGQDVNLGAAQLSAGNALAVEAGGNLNSTAVVDSASLDTAQASRKRSRTVQATAGTVKGSTFTAGGDIALQAGNDIALQAATVASEAGGIALAASRDVNLTTASETHSLQVDERRKKSGLFSSKTTTTHDKEVDTYAIGTTLSGETVQIAAGRDVTAHGAQVVGTGDVLIAAGRNLILDAAQSTRTEEHSKDTRKSGLMSGMGNGIGITIGSRKQGHSMESTQTFAEGSVVGSLEGNVTLVAGQDLTVRGSDVISATGTQMMGQNVTITSVEQTLDRTDSSYVKQSGLNVAVGGGIVKTVQQGYDAAKRGSEVEDDRLAALYAVKAGYAAKDTMAGAQGMSASNTTGQNASASGVNLRITVGGQSSDSQTVTHQTTQRGSNLQSGGDIAIVATGDGQGNGGDLGVIGSNIDGRNVDLAAARDLLIASSQDSYSSETRNRSQGGEIGVAISASSEGGAAFGLYVAANAARGKGDGEGVIHNESRINASETLSFSSGRDTTLEGAQLTADKVVGDVGRNLTVTSQQDVDRYQNESASAQGEMTIGYGFDGNASASYSQVDSDYASVKEQTGIQAGAGGFDIQVGGHTSLSGAAIASTADASRNRLSTGSLSATDIQNRAEYEAISVSVSSSGGGAPGQGMSGSFRPGMGVPQNEDAGSATRSGLSAGTLDVRDGTALANLDRSVTTLQQDGLKPIFDEQAVQELSELGQVAGEVGYRVAGTLAGRLQREAAEDLIQARANGDAQAEADALSRLENWSDGGSYRAVLHGLTGAVVASLGGGDAALGALGAGGAEQLRGEMARYLVSQGIEYGSGAFNSLMELGSLALGAALGEGSGAAAALLGEQYNRQLHPSELDWINANAQTFAEQQDISEQEARRRLTIEAAGRVDATVNRLLGYGSVDEEAIAFLYTAGPSLFTPTEEEYNDFNRGGAALVSDDADIRQVYNSLLSAGVDADDLKEIYHEILLLRGSAIVGSSGRGVTAVVGGSATAGILAGLAVPTTSALLTRCMASLAACNEMFATLAEAIGGDALGGHTLGTVTTGTVGAAAVADEVVEQVARRVDDQVAATAGRVDEAVESATDAVGGTLDDVASSSGATTTAGGHLCASKICESGVRMEPVTPIEKALADQIRAGNDQGGHLTEQLLGMIAERQGYTVLSGTKYGSNNGFDLVLQAADGSVTIVMDGKQMTNGTIQLSRGAGDNIQLTDKWVATVLDRLPINSPARLAIEKARRAQSLITAVGGVDRATGQVVITRVQVPGGD